MDHTGTIELRTPRLVLRRFVMEDDRDVYENFGRDPLVRRYVQWAPWTTFDGVLEFLAMNIEAYASPSFYGWAVELDGRVIGSAGAFDIDEAMRSCEYGMCIGSRWWGRGLATEAMRTVLGHLTGRVGFRRVTAACDERNAASARVIEKAGMAFEGRTPGALRDETGAYHDKLVYALTAGE